MPEEILVVVITGVLIMAVAASFFAGCLARAIQEIKHSELHKSQATNVLSQNKES